MAETTFRKSTAREYFESLVVAVILALFVRTFGFQAFKIPTGSMEPNLLVGDHLLVNKFIFGPATSGLERTLLPMRQVERGEVLVFKFPEDPERDFIKRVIGLPGETLEYKEQRVFINGMPLIEPYAHYQLPATSEGNSGDPRVQLRSGDHPGRPLLHDGRQPRRLAGQPLLGLPAGQLRQRPRALHLLVVRRTAGHAVRPPAAPDPLTRPRAVRARRPRRRLRDERRHAGAQPE